VELFDGVFESGYEGMRKPDRVFYERGLERTGAVRLRTVFVDDKSENVFAARSLGFRGVVFDETESVVRQLRCLLGDAVARGWELLLRGLEESITETGVRMKDTSTGLMISEKLTTRRRLTNLEPKASTRNFFAAKPVPTTDSFPDDLDSTSLALLIVEKVTAAKAKTMDLMLTCKSEDDIIPTYFSPTRPGTDPTVCINILRAFYAHARGHHLSPTLTYIRDVLYHRAYTHGGTRFYPPDAFLSLLDSTHSGTNPDLAALIPALEEALTERTKLPGNAAGLAMRVSGCQRVIVEYGVDLEVLQGLRASDGGWSAGVLFEAGRPGVGIGNRSVVTALAVKAIEGQRMKMVQRDGAEAEILGVVGEEGAKSQLMRVVEVYGGGECVWWVLEALFRVDLWSVWNR
ncbi:hypothetical protein K490DRAFT_34923, partial [Saccharata proteae CBS 121410]